MLRYLFFIILDKSSLLCYLHATLNKSSGYELVSRFLYTFFTNFIFEYKISQRYVDENTVNKKWAYFRIFQALNSII